MHIRSFASGGDGNTAHYVLAFQPTAWEQRAGGRAGVRRFNVTLATRSGALLPGSLLHRSARFRFALLHFTLIALPFNHRSLIAIRFATIGGMASGNISRLRQQRRTVWALRHHSGPPGRARRLHLSAGRLAAPGYVIAIN